MNVKVLRGLALAAIVALCGAPAVAADPANITVTLTPMPTSPPIIAAVSLGAAYIGNSEMFPALKEHCIDAGILIEPFIAGASDDVVSIAPIDDFVAKRFLATGWIAGDAWLAAHPDLTLRFAAVRKQTAEWANAHHKESAAVLLRYTKLTPEIVAPMRRATYGTALD